MSADATNPDIHSNQDPGCDSCGTCKAHDSCADSMDPLDETRGDCAACGACGPCIVDCTHERTDGYDLALIPREDTP